ncbi:MAG: LemA family protein [Firmicutes bacterium]|nr:LemA family protein [Bacillota bacterium]
MTWIIVLIVIVVLIAIWVASTYNSLISLRNRVKDAWSQIDVQLKRRFDLIPNLVETVKGYAKHESETLEEVIKARNSYVSATLPEDQMKADGELTQAISKLFALTEAYPDLKANQNFMDLQNDLQETEDKIAMSRQFYNDIVMQYNNKVEMVPSNIVANIFKFKTEAFFEVNESERENVKVKF